MTEIARGNKAVTQRGPTMDELLEQRMEARKRGDHATADRLSREIKRRVDESDAARYHKA
jgi:hypothetical protein